jgi:hypothetical protein
MEDFYFAYLMELDRHVKCEGRNTSYAIFPGGHVNSWNDVITDNSLVISHTSVRNLQSFISEHDTVRWQGQPTKGALVSVDTSDT